MTAPILVSVLGPLAVEVGGRPVPVGGRRQAGVLVRLVVAEGRSVSAETLAEDIWDATDAVDAARMAVSRLRQAIGPDVVRTSANGYRLDPSVCRTDVALFEATLAEARRHPGPASEQAARYDEALDLWRGEAFAGLRDLPWCVSEAERLDELRLSAISECVDARLRAGESTALIPDLERLVAEHPWREHLSEQLMVALYRAGRQREALNAFHRLESTLREELGIEPNPSARALHAAVLAQAPELDLEPPPSPAAGVAPTGISLDLGGGPLPGRSEDIERLRRAWQRAHSDAKARVVVVTGPPGIGKSTLLDHVAAGFERDGGTVLRTTCPPQDRVPFQALADALEACVPSLGDRVADPDLVALAAVLPGVGQLPLGDQTATAEPAMRRAVVHRALERALTLCIDAEPTALIIDDLQWIDAASLSFLSGAWGSLRDRPLLVVLGCRSNELAAEGPVTNLLSAMTEQSPVSTIELSGLDPQSTRDVVARLLPADWSGDAEALGSTVARTTGGHPFFVVELVRQVVASGHVSVNATSLEPVTLDATIEQQLARLAGGARTLLNVAAVVGPIAPTDLLASVVGRTPSDVTADADVAVQLGLLRPTLPNPGYAFSHSMIRQVLLEELSPPQRARLHASVGEALEAMGGRAEALSYHFVNAVPFVDAERAARAAVDAGDAAMDAAAFEDAAGHYRRALDVLPSAPFDPAVRVRALINLGNALATGVEAEPALRCFQDAAALAREQGLGELFAEAISGRAQFGVRHEDREQDVQMVDDALEMLSDRDSWIRARLLLWGGWLLLYGVDQHLAEPYIESGLAIAQRLDDPHALAAALQLRHAMLVANLAPLEERDRVRDQIRKLPSRLTRYEGTLINGASAFDDLIEHGDLDVLRRELERYRRDADEIGRPYDRWSARSIRVVAEMWTGDLDAAEVAMNDAATFGRSMGVGVADGVASGHLLALAWERGQLGDAVPIVEAVTTTRNDPPYWNPVLALAYRAAGREEEAREALLGLSDGFPQFVHAQQRAYMCVMAAESVDLVGDHAVTAVVERELERYAGRIYVAATAIYTMGPYDRMLGLCALARGSLDLAVERLQAARLLAQKVQMVLWEPRAAVAEADARFRRGGRSDVEGARELLELVDRSASTIGSALLEGLAAKVRARHGI
jgi:DNA-binding SARP family transcriptional activator